MTSLIEDTLISVRNKLEKELERMKESLTDEERAELEEKQKQYEQIGKNIATAFINLLNNETPVSEPEPKKENPEKFEKTPFNGFKDVVSAEKTKPEEKKQFKGFEDAMIQNLGSRCKKEDKPVKDKPIQLVEFRNEDIHESLASKVMKDVAKQTSENDDKLYKSLCKDIDCALLAKEYTINDDRTVIIEICNRDIYRKLNSTVINSVVDHYVEDEDFKSVNIALTNIREPGGNSTLRVYLTF